MNAFTKRAIGKRMATVFIEYKPSGKKTVTVKHFRQLKWKKLLT